MDVLRRQFVIVVVALVCPLLTSSASARGQTKDVYVAGLCVTGSPRPQMATTAWSKARQLAASIPGAFVVQGRGRSMQPLYQSGTLLVIKPVAYEELTRGMSVVFRSHDRSITHVLVAKTKDGWRTAGLHNRRHDYVPVNSQNIQGVVVAAFTPVEGKRVALR